MGSNTNPQKIVQFMEASDIDTRLDPEPLGVFPAIAKLKKKTIAYQYRACLSPRFLTSSSQMP
jgi:hypothetical protein